MQTENKKTYLHHLACGITVFRIAFTLLENPMHVKDKELKEALCSIVVTCVSKYGYLEPVTSTIVNLLHKHEHLPIHLADLVTLAEEKYHDSSLLVAILQEIGGLNPEDFKHDKSGAESVGDFLVALADRVPKLMTQNLSLITPHLDSDAYKMRNAVVQVVGKLVAKASKDPSLDNAAGDETLRLRSKQVCCSVPSF
jgi:condensin complex subunit 1